MLRMVKRADNACSASVSTLPSRRCGSTFAAAAAKTIRGLSADACRRVRQEKSKPLVMAFRPWLEQQLARVSGKAEIAEELRYGLNHWDGLRLGQRRGGIRGRALARH